MDCSKLVPGDKIAIRSYMIADSRAEYYPAKVVRVLSKQIETDRGEFLAAANAKSGPG